MLVAVSLTMLSETAQIVGCILGALLGILAGGLYAASARTDVGSDASDIGGRLMRWRVDKAKLERFFMIDNRSSLTLYSVQAIMQQRLPHGRDNGTEGS